MDPLARAAQSDKNANAFAKGVTARRAHCCSGGGAERDRTANLRVANAALSQLSYGPTNQSSYGLTNQLSYGPTNRLVLSGGATR